jgi:hypothetical protein
MAGSTMGCSSSSTEPPPAFATLAPLSPTDGGATNPSPSPGPSASPSAAASPSPAPVDAAAKAIEAATKELNALYRSPLNRDSCLKDNPDNKPCIALTSADAAIAGGVAAVTGGYPDGGGFAFLMGQGADGNWHYWYGSQQGFYVLVNLPGDVRVCGAGQPVNVGSSSDPSSGAAGTLPDGSTAHALKFVLTKAGTPGVNGSRGEGSYQIDAPVSGWIDARNAADASLGDCKLRDAVEGAPPHG